MSLRQTVLPPLLLLSLTALALPRAATANGRFPNAQQVLIGPATGAASTIVLRVTFGLVVSRDGGQTFRWYCEDVMYEPYVLSMSYDPPVELTRFGTVVFGFNHGVHAITDGCSSTGQPDLAEREIIDLAATPDGATVFALDATPGQPGRILRASATTLRFVPVGVALPNVRLTTLDVAPTDPRRLYLSGADTVGNPLLLRSDDGGGAVRSITPGGDLGDATFIAGVDPTNPEIVYVRTTRALGSTLLRSDDGGARFETVARTADEMLGFALSDDGRTVWYGSNAGGLFRSDDRGRSFQPINALPVFCLKHHLGALWACTDWQREGYALGRSTDAGRSFVSVLRWDDLPGPPACTAGTPAAQTCTDRWPGFQRQLLFPEIVADAGVATDLGARDAAAHPFDVGTAAPVSPADGCACHLARRSQTVTAHRWSLRLAFLALLGRRRRRRDGAP